MPHVVDTHAWQADFSASKLPCGVIHGPNPSAAIREHPDRIDSTLRLHDRPCSIVQDHDVGAFGLERFGRDDEDASTHPLQAAHVAVAQPRVDGEEGHAGEVGR